MSGMNRALQRKKIINHPNTKKKATTKPVSAANIATQPIWSQNSQSSLRVNHAGDRYEREANRVSEQVMRMPIGAVQRQDIQENEGMLQRQTLDEEEQGTLMTKSGGGGAKGGQTAPASVHQTLGKSGSPLDNNTRAFMEPRFGRDFSDVRIHTDSQATQSTNDVQAAAYTVGNNVVFGEGRYQPSSDEGKRLIAHELTHVVQQGDKNIPNSPITQNDIEQGNIGHLLQRAEVDDDPKFCKQPNGKPLKDSKDIINNWISSAKSVSKKDGNHIVTAIYNELGKGTGVTKAEKKLASLANDHVRHVKMSESRYSGPLGLWPVDPFSKLALLAGGKIFVAPVINLCGVCVGTDKVGHFFQQGYEYFRLGQELRAKIKSMTLEEKKQYWKRLKGPLPEYMPILESDDTDSGLEVEFSEGAYEEFIVTSFISNFGLWLEGFNHQLSKEDVKWIKSRKFIPWYYSEGVYGRESTGVLSRADLQANIQGYYFYQDLWHDPKKISNICDYVGSLWNERKELSTPSKALGTPDGPISHSMDINP